MIATILIGATAGLAMPQTATLSCGAGRFTVQSRRWDGQRLPLAPAIQAATVHIAGKRLVIPLERTPIVVVEGYRVRNRYLSSWSCVTGVTGRAYVILGYACAIDRGYPNDCGGEPEWFRYLDERGRVVDAGVPYNGAARTRLQRRLGIARAMRNGVPGTSVVN